MRCYALMLAVSGTPHHWWTLGCDTGALAGQAAPLTRARSSGVPMWKLWGFRTLLDEDNCLDLMAMRQYWLSAPGAWRGPFPFPRVCCCCAIPGDGELARSPPAFRVHPRAFFFFFFIIPPAEHRHPFSPIFSALPPNQSETPESINTTLHRHGQERWALLPGLLLPPSSLPSAC